METVVLKGMDNRTESGIHSHKWDDIHVRMLAFSEHVLLSLVVPILIYLRWSLRRSSFPFISKSSWLLSQSTIWFFCHPYPPWCSSNLFSFFFPHFFQDRVSWCSPSYPGTRSVDQALPPKCWDQRGVPPLPGWSLKKIIMCRSVLSVCIPVHYVVTGGQKMASDPMELELWLVMR